MKVRFTEKTGSATIVKLFSDKVLPPLKLFKYFEEVNHSI